MNIEDITLGQARQLTAFLGVTPEKTKHPLIGTRVVAVLAHGFIHLGTLQQEQGTYRLDNAYNLRTWKQRDGGLPEFAANGPTSGDTLDKIGSVYFENALFFYPLGGNSDC